MDKKIRELMEKHNLPQSARTVYGLEIERIVKDYAKDLQHHHDTTVGLYATDRPNLIKDPSGILFRIDGIPE